MLPTSRYPRKSLNNIRGIALRLRCIYLIPRDYKPSIVKHFVHVSTLSRQQARQLPTGKVR